MRYLGGKALLAKTFADIIESNREKGQPYIEPFVGGAWVITEVTGERYGYDLNSDLIAMYQALQQGWIPPDNVTEEEYNQVKAGTPVAPCYRAFVGFGCSFGGKWFGGYGRGATRNYCGEAKRSLMKQAAKWKGVKFDCLDYSSLKPVNSIIYCDPPYRGATPYNGTPPFDSNKFWSIMREWAKNNILLISEYEAPDDFCLYWEKSVHLSVSRTTKQRANQRVERLYTK